MSERMASLREILLMPPAGVWGQLIPLFGDWPSEDGLDVGISYAIEHMKKDGAPPMEDFSVVDEAHPCWQIAAAFLPVHGPVMSMLIKAIRRFRQESKEPIDGIVCLNAIGEHDEAWCIDGRKLPMRLYPCRDIEGDDIDCLMTFHFDDLMDLMTGKASGPMLFMTGRLKISGNMSIAMKLSSLFE